MCYAVEKTAGSWGCLVELFTHIIVNVFNSDQAQRNL